MEDFHVRYDVSNPKWKIFVLDTMYVAPKNGKIMLQSDSKGGIKRKENEKRGYRRIESFLVLF